MSDLIPVRRVDKALVAVARDIRVLAQLEWDPRLHDIFLDAWRRGEPQLPVVSYRNVDYTRPLFALDALVTEADRLDHPLGRFLRQTAESYLTVVRMLDNINTPAMSALSKSIYGSPDDPITGGQGTSSLDAAKYFLSVAGEFYHAHQSLESDFCLSAQSVAAEIKTGLAEVFPDGVIQVQIDKTLAAKAAAGATRIRLRDATCFSEYDHQQLLQHEAFVHSLTALNGRRQPNLSTLGIGAPRTTAAQEGLATFAELVTGAIDIARLERIAMRIVAIDMALGGADFIEIFKYFMNAGQPESESYNSTVRVFRGAPLGGGYAFTKDSVYLRGLLEVHTFFRWALKEQKLTLAQHFFAGRMTLADVIRYEAFFLDGTLAPAAYLPPWMTRTTGLAGYLAFAVFANNIDLSSLYADHEFHALG